MTKSVSDVANLFPDWTKAIERSANGIVTIEVPINGTQFSRAIVDIPTEVASGRMALTPVASKLIVRKILETDVVQYFVATMIADHTYAAQQGMDEGVLHYLARGDFSGLVIISDVLGRYLQSYLHTPDGEVSRVYFGQNDTEQPATSLMRFNLLTTQQATNDFMATETGLYWCKQCRRTYTSRCVTHGFNIEDVDVYPTCPRCHQRICICPCPICHQSVCICCTVCNTYPCICDKDVCRYCGSPYCDGSCRDSGGSSGGDGGDGGGGGEGSLPTGTPKYSASVIENAAKNAVRSLTNTDGHNPAMCNVGVAAAFKTITKSSELDGKLANEMISYWQDHDQSWRKINPNEAWSLVNSGYIVVAGWMSPNPNGHGHVVLCVPGSGGTHPAWGYKLPNVMETGAGRRTYGNTINYSFGKEKISGIVCFVYIKQ